MELSETWSPAAIHDFGTHELKFGALVTQTSDPAHSRPTHQVENAGRPIAADHRFRGRQPIQPLRCGDGVFFAGSLDAGRGLALGSRHPAGAPEHFGNIPHRAARRGFVVAVRRRTHLVQAGYGIFYDRVPLEVYAFDRFPQRVVTNYAPDGSALSAARHVFESHGLRRHARIRC